MPHGHAKAVKKIQGYVISPSPAKVQMGYSSRGLDRNTSSDSSDISSFDPDAARVEHSRFDLPEYDDADTSGDYGTRDD